MEKTTDFKEDDQVPEDEEKSGIPTLDIGTNSEMVKEADLGNREALAEEETTETTEATVKVDTKKLTFARRKM